MGRVARARAYARSLARSFVRSFVGWFVRVTSHGIEKRGSIPWLPETRPDVEVRRTRQNWRVIEQRTGRKKKHEEGGWRAYISARRSREISKSTLLALMSRDADRLLAYGEMPARCVAKVGCRVAWAPTPNTSLNAVNRLTTARSTYREILLSSRNDDRSSLIGGNVQGSVSFLYIGELDGLPSSPKRGRFVSFRRFLFFSTPVIKFRSETKLIFEDDRSSYIVPNRYLSRVRFRSKNIVPRNDLRWTPRTKQR